MTQAARNSTFTVRSACVIYRQTHLRSTEADSRVANLTAANGYPPERERDREPEIARVRERERVCLVVFIYIHLALGSEVFKGHLEG